MTSIRHELGRLQLRLDAAFKRTPGDDADPELRSDHAKFLCVLVSGYLEQAMVAIAVALAEHRSAPEVRAFVEVSLDRWANANSEKIQALFGAFRPEWRLDLEGYLVDERKAAVNSIVALRNGIAHGESVGTSVRQVSAYYAEVRAVVEHVADMVGLP